MTHPLSYHIIDQEPDPLWRHEIRHRYPGSVLIDLGADRRPRHTPSHRDYPGWQQWLKANPIKSIHLWQPGPRSIPLCLALATRDIHTRIILTRAPRSINAMLLNHLRFLADEIVCFSRPLALRLLHMHIDRNKLRLKKITPAAPPSATPACPAQSGNLPAAITALALPFPDSMDSLKSIIWAGALVYHTLSSFKLVIAGPLSSALKTELILSQALWHCPDMLILDDQSSWSSLLSAASLVIDSRQARDNLLRLLSAQSASRPTISADPVCRDYLTSSRFNFILDDDKPRLLAGKILSLIEELGSPQN